MDSRVKVLKGSIVELTVDAIVNAAHQSLLGGGGVDGAIHRAAGEALEDECYKIYKERGGCKTGEAVITTAGNLPSKFVIHTVGPVWFGGDEREEEKLRSCYRSTLLLAAENNIKSIAFPNISTGVFSFPKELAFKIATEEVDAFLNSNNTLEEVIFICFDTENFILYSTL